MRRIQGSLLLRSGDLISSCLLGERKLPDHLFISQKASDHSAMNDTTGREEVSIPYGNRTRVFDMKRRCPNHWTKGTKKNTFFASASAPRIEVVRFVSIRNSTISFVFMLFDVNSAGRPPFLRVPHRPSDTSTRPFLFSDHQAPDPFLCLSSSRPALSNNI